MIPVNAFDLHTVTPFLDTVVHLPWQWSADERSVSNILGILKNRSCWFSRGSFSQEKCLELLWFGDSTRSTRANATLAILKSVHHWRKTAKGHLQPAENQLQIIFIFRHKQFSSTRGKNTIRYNSNNNHTSQWRHTNVKMSQISSNPTVSLKAFSN